ncbi:hypothetical protein F1654_03280 [Alkalicaulis satelles]|uniref:Peptidase C-terminal archaeal/bacterial domain-containing protein n=1 Tax=Alkalicaulis satelles TaxID=2609175 RepID=A0A5M6ZJN4_9PROT|nr:hypothetical protein [Alkalicaulis satelles]KAA5805032.1 hypothetical protein F1654_03280 [Alkalicaulis satelles]
MKIRVFAAGAACAVLAAASVGAQETEHEISLRSGFMPDPLGLTVSAGGSMSASDLVSRTRGVGGARMGDAGDGHCRGSVSQAPTVRMDYTTHGRMPLIITHRADFDTTLVVRGPDGTWYCDDDSGEGLDAQLVLESPRTGTYEIWAGVFGRSNRGRESTLSLSELRGQIAGSNRPSPPSRGNGEPASGPDQAETQIVQLTEGFTPDPHVIEAEAGGSRTARRLTGSDVLARTGQEAQRCLTGHVTDTPTVRLEYETSGFFPLFLTLSPVGNLNTALLVRAPDGALFCAQGTSDEPGAQLVFDDPQSGAYEIWFGRRVLSQSGQAALAISEIGATADEDDLGSGWHDPDAQAPGDSSSFGDIMRALSGLYDDAQDESALDASLPPRGGALSASFNDLAARAHTINTRINATHGLGSELASVTVGEAGDRRCRGHSGQAPDLTAEISGRAQGDLVFTAEGDFDTTLAVLAPDGTWYCDDDSGRGTQAVLAISDPEPGTYAVWLGAFLRSRDGADGAVQVSVR